MKNFFQIKTETAQVIIVELGAQNQTIVIIERELRWCGGYWADTFPLPENFLPDTRCYLKDISEAAKQKICGIGKSFNSLLESNQIYLSNPMGKKPTMPEIPNCENSFSVVEMVKKQFDLDLQKWQSFEKNTLQNPYVLIQYLKENNKNDALQKSRTMKPLITREQAEKARCPFEMHVINYCGLSENVNEKQPIAMDFGTLVDMCLSVSQAANSQYADNVVPVIERARDLLERQSTYLKLTPFAFRSATTRGRILEIQSCLDEINELLKS